MNCGRLSRRLKISILCCKVQAASDPAAQKEFLIESQTQIERLAWITANLLDLSRLDAGLLELDLAEHDLREIIEFLQRLSYLWLVRKESPWISSYQIPQSHFPLTVRDWKWRLAIYWIMPSNFRLKYGKVCVILEGSGNSFSVLVRDSGIGIPPSDLPNIFERFYRGRGQAVEGSGLGLSIVKSVVEAHGGSVSVESTMDEGTTFRLFWDDLTPSQFPD